MLEEFCGRLTKTWADVPFSVVDVQGKVWSVASDWVWLVAIRGKSQYQRFAGPPAVRSDIVSLIQYQPPRLEKVATERLRQWAPLRSSYHPDEPDTFFVPEKDPTGLIFDVQVNRYRLGKILTLVADENVSVWNASDIPPFNGTHPCIGLESLNVRAYLVGYERSANVGGLETFIFSGPEVSLFDLAMGMDSV